jgi:hypothetical protein
MKPLVPILFALFLIGCASRSATVRNAQIAAYGTFEKLNSTGIRPAPGSLQGKAETVAAATLVEQTTEIHASAGKSFGVRVRFIGTPAGGAVAFTVKCLHPKLTDPESGRSSESDQWENVGLIGDEGYVGYTFEKDWEMVPGTWTIQIFVGPKLIAEKSFSVTSEARTESPGST